MPPALIVRVFAPFALGYFFVSVFRSINAVIAPDLVRDLDLSASGLGFAVSAYFLSATLLQLPLGVLLDRYDPRRVYAACLVLSALGAIITAAAVDILSLAAGRALIALGGATSAVVSYKVYSLWFAPERLPLANGLSLAAGSMGVMAGTLPVEAALQFVGWRTIHVTIAGVLIICAVIVLATAPKKQTEEHSLTVAGQVKGLGVILKSLVFWRTAPLMMAVVGIFGSMNSLWAGPWVRDVAGLSSLQAANLLLVLAGSMTLAGLATGWLTALARRFGLAPMQFMVLTSALFAIVVVILFLQWTPNPHVVFATWALFGFLASLNFVTYAALAPRFPRQLTGRLNACLTLSWMLGAFLFQNLYGIVLEYFPATNGGYSIAGHRVATGIMIVSLVMALAWYFASSRLEKIPFDGSDIEAPIE